jgi:hypothetical protein
MKDSFQFSMLKGVFLKQDALDLLTKITDLKIKYHENKIVHSDTPEDIKSRENRIKQLQKDLYEARMFIQNKEGLIDLSSDITIK